MLAVALIQVNMRPKSEGPNQVENDRRAATYVAALSRDWEPHTRREICDAPPVGGESGECPKWGQTRS